MEDTERCPTTGGNKKVFFKLNNLYIGIYLCPDKITRLDHILIAKDIHSIITYSSKNTLVNTLFLNEPRHGKMCLRGKFDHFEIL